MNFDNINSFSFYRVLKFDVVGTIRQVCGSGTRWPKFKEEKKFSYNKYAALSPTCVRTERSFFH